MMKPPTPPGQKSRRKGRNDEDELNDIENHGEAGEGEGDEEGEEPPPKPKCERVRIVYAEHK